MSAAMASSTELDTVYVRLLDEGTDVWRPVPAHRISESVYELVADPAPEDEVWAFAPGEAVVIERRSDQGEADLLVAVAKATDLDELSVAWVRRAS